ncbi:hypothetical protein Tco_0568111 [Tanacetum coccineum]
MHGTSLTKQEKDCKLYDEFDKFAYKKGETLRAFYLRFSLLLNDINIYNMKLEQFYVNTKFLNTLPLEWSKFVTDVKLSQQYSNNQSSTPLSITYPSNDYQSSVHHNVYSLPSSIPQLEYAPIVNQQSEFPQLDLGIIVPVFQKGDDPIDDAINHMMQQATINDGRVTLQPIQWRDTSFAVGHILYKRHLNLEERDDSWFKIKIVVGTMLKQTSQILPEDGTSILQIHGICRSCSYGEFISLSLVEVHNHDNVDNNMINQVVQVMPSFEQSNVVNHSETEITSDSNIIPYSQYVIESQQKAQQLELKLYDGNVINKRLAIVIPDSEKTLMLAEESRSKMLLKQKDPMMLEKESQY